MFETHRTAGICRLEREGARWLASGWDGGYRTADAAYNVSVPTGFERTDLDAYARERLSTAGFDRSGPVLLTGVGLTHARGARAGSVTVIATVGLSNPATLPTGIDRSQASESERGDRPPVGTVNLLVGTTRALADGTLATLLATAVEAKTATLQSHTGFTGTTSDAVAVGCDPSGDRASFAGSGTELGSATRACVRDAVAGSLRTRYADRLVPDTVSDADHGVVTDRGTESFRP